MKKNVMKNHIVFCLLSLGYVGCTTTQKNCDCSTVNQTNVGSGQYENLSPEQATQLASEYFAEGKYQESLKVLDTVPAQNRDLHYQKLRQDVINKIVMNMRYKVRVLYEKSLAVEGSAKKDLLHKCKKLLESIIKNYPEYSDMYAVKNNLKQIDRALGKKT